MLKINRRVDKFLPFFVALIIAVSVLALACEWIPESSFELASESRLPKWITLPPGITRADVSITMTYYIKPWGNDAEFLLQDKKGQTLKKVEGKVKGLEPLQLKHPPSG